MSVFTHPEFDSHEELVFCRDAASGLSAITAAPTAVPGCQSRCSVMRKALNPDPSSCPSMVSGSVSVPLKVRP